VKTFNEIANFGKKLTALNSMENILELISEEAKRLSNAERCSIFMVDNQDHVLWTKINNGIGRIVVGLDSGIVGDTYTKKEGQIVNDPYEDSRFLPAIDKKSGFITKNMITVPIFNSKREIMGVIQLLNKSRFDFDEKDLEILTFLANYVSGSLEIVLMSDN